MAKENDGTDLMKKGRKANGVFKSVGKASI